MTEAPPALFLKRLGGLYPANPEAERIMAALAQNAKVRVRVTSMRGNDRRMALYWVVLAKVAPMLSEICEGDALNDVLLHRVLKDRAGLVKKTVLPSGDAIKDYDSISFAKMPEPDRAKYIDWAFQTLSKWIGVPVETLLEEAS